MAFDVNLRDISGTAADFDANGAVATTTPGYSAAGAVQFGGPEAGPACFMESDPGTVTGARYVLSPEVDDDYRIRVALDTPLDTETFDYAAQNTGKHTYVNTTMTATWSAAGVTTNSANITTTTTGLTIGSYAHFPIIGAAQLYCETELAFTAAATANTIVDFGLFLRGAAPAYAPLDGVYFRRNAAGMFGVINSNGSETTTAVFPFTHTLNRVYQFVVAIHEREVEFWIDDVLYARLSTPAGLGQPCMATALPWSLRHAIVGGAAGSALSVVVKDYNITIGGAQLVDGMGTISNRMYGSYQGLSGGTMGSLASYTNNALPTAAVPSNTALTANLIAGLGGQCIETDTLAVTTDGIIASYQVPAGTVNVAGRRLRISGVKITSFVQTALTGGGYNDVWTLAFGGTTVNLTTAEAAAAKARRIIPLGSRSVASGAVALTQLPDVALTLTNPVYVNPGEFVQVCRKKIGTAPSAGALFHTVTLDYCWE